MFVKEVLFIGAIVSAKKTRVVLWMFHNVNVTLNGLKSTTCHCTHGQIAV